MVSKLEWQSLEVEDDLPLLGRTKKKGIGDSVLNHSDFVKLTIVHIIRRKNAVNKRAIHRRMRIAGFGSVCHCGHYFSFGLK